MGPRHASEDRHGGEHPLESNMVSKAIEQAQTKVEGHNFDVRKHVVEYDDVMNTQRDLIYRERRKILNGDNIRSNVQGMIDEEFRIMLAPLTAEEDNKKATDTVGFINELKTIMPLPPEFTESHLKEIPVTNCTKRSQAEPTISTEKRKQRSDQSE